MRKCILILTILAVLTSCSSGSSSSIREDDNSIHLRAKEVVLKAGEKYQIDARSNHPINYISKDEFLTKVSEEGLITAQKTGETTILLSSEFYSTTFKVTIESEYEETYDDPIKSLGKSKSEIMRMHESPSIRNRYALCYLSYDVMIPDYFYIFDENDEVIEATLILEPDISQNIISILDERYLALEIKKYTRFYINNYESQATASIESQAFYLGAWMITYAPYPANRAKKHSNINTQEILDELIEKRQHLLNK